MPCTAISEDAEASEPQVRMPDDEETAATPRATAVENEFGGIDLNIDLTAIQKMPAKHLLMRRLLGPKWDAHLPTLQDFVGKKTLTLADYKRRQGIVWVCACVEWNFSRHWVSDVIAHSW